MKMRATRAALPIYTSSSTESTKAECARAEVEAMEDLWKATHDFATQRDASWGAVLRALQRLEDMETAA